MNVRPAGREACNCASPYNSILERLDAMEAEILAVQATANSAMGVANAQAGAAASSASAAAASATAAGNAAISAAADASDALTQATASAGSADDVADSASDALTALQTIEGTIASVLASDIGGKVDKLTTAGFYLYMHNGSTQGEVQPVVAPTAATIPIRDSDGRMQAADPASGATDKTLVTANWVSQTGTGAPNNLMHINGDEVVDGSKDYIQHNVFSSPPYILPGGTDRVNGTGWVKVYESNNVNHLNNIFAVLPRRCTANPGFGIIATGIHWTVANQVFCKWMSKDFIKSGYVDCIMISTELNGPATLWAKNISSTDNMAIRLLAESYNGSYLTASNSWKEATDRTIYTMDTDAGGNITGYTDGDGVTHTFYNFAISE